MSGGGGGGGGAGRLRKSMARADPRRMHIRRKYLQELGRDTHS